MQPWTVSDREVVFSARRWQVERSARSKPGEPTKHEFFTLRMPHFVVAAPVTRDAHVVMVRQFRHGAEVFTLELPGGLLDAHELDHAAAARREMLEETGYDAPALEPIGVVHPNPALLNNRCFFFVARDAAVVSSQQLETTEDATVELVPLADLDRLVREGHVSNALMIAGLRLLQLHLARG